MAHVDALHEEMKEIAGYELQDFLENEVTVPKKDGTRGSALYAVPIDFPGGRTAPG